MLAAADVGDLAVAGLTAAGVVLAAVVPAALALVADSRRKSAELAATRSQVEQAAQAIGEPNGSGNVVQMLESILAGQAGQDNRIARLEGGQHEIRTHVARLEGRVDVIERRPTG